MDNDGDLGSPRAPHPARRSARTILVTLGLGTAALVTAFASGCSRDLGAIDIPWKLDDAPAPAKTASSRAAQPAKSAAPGKPAATIKSAATNANAAADDAASSADADCDELPELTADELRGPPYDVSLQKQTRTPGYAPPRFATLPDVTLSVDATTAINRIDDAFFKRTKKHLVITSGTRDAGLQAKAMYKMIRLGADIVRLYKNKEAAREVRKAYDENAKKPADVAIVAMYDVLKAQIDRGVYISAHLRAGAVDVRNRTMTNADRRAFLKSIAEAGDASVLEETKPPHYHLQLK